MSATLNISTDLCIEQSEDDPVRSMPVNLTVTHDGGCLIDYKVTNAAGEDLTAYATQHSFTFLHYLIDHYLQEFRCPR